MKVETREFGRTRILRHKFSGADADRHALSTLKYRSPHNSDRIRSVSGFDASLPGEGPVVRRGRPSGAAIVETSYSMKRELTRAFRESLPNSQVLRAKYYLVYCYC